MRRRAREKISIIAAKTGGSRRELHKTCACGKTVHEVCTPGPAFVHFSLAPPAPIGDNPALSHSGATWAGKFNTGRAGTTGAKQSVPARAYFPKPEER